MGRGHVCVCTPVLQRCLIHCQLSFFECLSDNPGGETLPNSVAISGRGLPLKTGNNLIDTVSNVGIILRNGW